MRCHRRDRNNDTNNGDVVANDDYDLNKEWTDTMDDLWNVTNKTVGRFSNALSSYSDRVFDQLHEIDLPGIGTAVSAWPMSRPAGDEAKEINKDRAPASCSNLWAYPVPSFRQYNKCMENNGVSAWSRDGVWRCLFPNSVQDLDFDGTQTASEDRRWFKDYSVFLDWRRAMYVAQLTKVQQELDAKKQQRQQSFESSDWKQPFGSSSKDVKYVSESEAEKQGKRVISSSIVSETVSQEDGTLQTKQRIKKWYDDNTVSVTETTDAKPQDSKGWFWK